MSGICRTEGGARLPMLTAIAEAMLKADKAPDGCLRPLALLIQECVLLEIDS